MSAAEKAYSTKEWFWAINLIGLLGAVGFCLPNGLAAIGIFPFALVVSLIISWLFVAPFLAVGMRKPASWARTLRWGAGTAAALAGVGFIIAQARRWQAQRDTSFNYQLGGGDYIRVIDGVLTPYGWWIVLQNNVLFVVLGVMIALIVRAILGPGKPVS